MNDLTQQKCQPCEGGIPALTFDEAKTQIHNTPEWQLNDRATEINRKFTFSDFNQTIKFVNDVAKIANEEGHHPDLEVSYGYCIVKFTTHAINGLSINDFICAAKIDTL